MIGIDILCLILGLGIGFGTGWICYRVRHMSVRQGAQEQLTALRTNLNALQIEMARVSERNRILEETQQGLQNELAQERQFNVSLHAELSRERTSRNHLEKRLEQQKGDVHDLQQRLTHEFKGLVEQVLAEKSQTLTDVNQSSLHLLLQPIADKLQEFKQKIEEQHFRETRELIVLHNKLANLESGRWMRPYGVVNGSGIIAGTDAPPEPAEANHNAYVAYDAESAEPEEVADETRRSGTLARHDLPVECGGSHTFTPKQQGEIDNFFKRIVGKSHRKKPIDGAADAGVKES